jgi:hypothetical protein
MKFALQGEHRDFFAKNGYIEFEGLLSEKDVVTLKEAIDQVLCKRLKVLPEKLEHKTAQELYMAGRDVWRDHPAIKKWTTSPILAELASSLFKKRPIRLAFDQVLRTGSSSHTPFINTASLQQTSSLRQIIGALILQLTPLAEPCIPLAQVPGSGVLIGPNFPLNFDAIFSQPHLSALMIVFCGEKTVYTLDSSDHHTHALKRQGYVFGDRLRDDINPLVFR